MNFTEMLMQLNQASAFDLYRLRAAIDRSLDQPGWMAAVLTKLRPGMTIEYFDAQDNRAYQGRVLALKRKQAAVLNLETKKAWLISYASINLAGADVTIRDQPRTGLSRHTVAVGDWVGFVDKAGLDRVGRVVRLNDKTVTLTVGNQTWRVAYGLLHPVLDVNASAVPERAGIVRPHPAPEAGN